MACCRLAPRIVDLKTNGLNRIFWTCEAILKRDKSLVMIPNGLIVCLLNDLLQHIAVNISMAGKDHATRLPLGVSLDQPDRVSVVRFIGDDHHPFLTGLAVDLEAQSDFKIHVPETTWRDKFRHVARSIFSLRFGALVAEVVRPNVGKGAL